MSDTFKLGDLVWAKMAGYPHWPGRVCEPHKPDESKKNFLWIYFFGSGDYAWIEKSKIKLYHEHKAKYIADAKGARLKKAVKAIEDYIENKMADPSFELKMPKVVEDTDSDKKSPKKPTKKRLSKDDLLDKSYGAPSTKKQRRTKSEFESNGSEHVVADAGSDHLNDSLELPSNHLTEQQQDNMEDSDTHSSTVFGFLGLGVMGTCVVKNLIIAGKRLNIWDEDQEKCQAIENEHPDALVQSFGTPFEVVLNSDIIFCCVADANAAGKILFGSSGVLSANDLDSKGYVEMTMGIDPKTSNFSAEKILEKGGKYLEVQLQGTREDADKSHLVVLTAGDQSLFHKCQSCFKAMGKTAFFLGSVGNATKMNMVINLIGSIAMVGFAEALSLAERAGLRPKNVLEIFSLTSHKSDYMMSKGNRIINKDYDNPDHAIEQMQKNLEICLDLSFNLKQPLMMGTAANELLKYALRMGYTGKDCSCVYVVPKHQSCALNDRAGESDTPARVAERDQDSGFDTEENNENSPERLNVE